MATVLAKVAAFEKALATAQDPAEVKQLLDQAQAIEALSKSQKDLTTAVAMGCFSLRCIRKVAYALRDAEHPPGRPQKGDTMSPFTDLLERLKLADEAGRRKAQRWQESLGFPDDAHEAYLQLCEQTSTIPRFSYVHREATKKKIEEETFVVPAGEYRTIVVDPPWPMEKIKREVRPNQVDFDYPTMSVCDIANLKLPLAEEGHVYLWTTQKFLPQAFDILSTWGLEYMFAMVWHKPGGFQPIGFPQFNCEFVLFGKRGSLPFLDTKAFNCAFTAPRREHSRKPDEFYDLVSRVSPGPRIDMFSREARDRFAQHGAETGRFADVV